MGLSKPYRRTTRQLADGSYGDNGNSRYLIHPGFATDPVHYIRAFEVIQADFRKLLEYIEPADQNLNTYSFRTHELLMRSCVEVEANFKAIFIDNMLTKVSPEHLTMRHYRAINKTHRLDAFKVKLPAWTGEAGVRQPFSAWSDSAASLPWYQAYNQSKHDRYNAFKHATFEHLLDAISALVVILSAQFHQEEYSPSLKTRGIDESYSYGASDGFVTAIGNYFRVLFPTDWLPSERYDFDWQKLELETEPFDRIDYDLLMKSNR